ncbi:MAG: DUF7453 family protein [Methylobacter sp.]
MDGISRDFNFMEKKAMSKTLSKYNSAIFKAKLVNKPGHSQVRKTPFISAIVFSLTLGIAGEAWATPVGVSITKIIDKTTLPSSVSAYPDLRAEFTPPPSISGDEVAFSGLTPTYISDPLEGIFSALDGSFGIYDSWSTFKGAHATGFSLDKGTVAYTFSGWADAQSVRISSNGIRTFVTGGNILDKFSEPTVSDGVIAFSAKYSALDYPPSGIYTYTSGVYIYNNNVSGSSPVAIVTPYSSVPGGTGKFASFGAPSINGSLVAFGGGGSNGENGIYATDIGIPGVVDIVVDKNTPIPEGTGNFIDFGKPSLYDNNIAFRGADSNGHQGIYIEDGTSLNVIVDTLTPTPDGVGNFTGFGDPALGENLLAFFGSDSNSGRGIYVYRIDAKQNQLLKIIDTGEQLDGKTIEEFGFGRGGLSGNKLVFVARFSDGTSGVYKAKIATNKDHCKNNGSKFFGFKNQGQCIQSVNDGKHGGGDDHHYDKPGHGGKL